MSNKFNPFEAFSVNGSTDSTVAHEQFAVHVANNAATPLFASLSTEAQNRSMTLAGGLVLSQYEKVLAFGLPAQGALKKFTAQMLSHIQRRDVSKVGDVLFDLMQQLESIDPDVLIEEEKGFFGRLFATPKAIYPRNHDAI